MRKIKTAVVGTGFMGKVHSEAIRRLGNVEIAAIVGSNARTAAAFGEAIGVERTTGDYKELLNDREIEAVHIRTPNASITRCRRPSSKRARRFCARSL